MRVPWAIVGLCFASLALLPNPATASGITPPLVEEAIALRRSRVEEFRVIKEAAAELGFRVWLFGGTAAGFAHYVRWDLAREEGDPRYRESFFDYDFTNIYRSTQDADLVVDATPEQAVQLEKLIKQKMSFLQGSKEEWEVRLLRYPRTVGEQVKLPLLGNPDFLEQNTDSNSTGMIELTDPPRGEAVVRDLRDWDSSLPFFLRDVTEGRLHYYLSPTHQKTSRYLSGDNPPIFSVIRYLVKAFQYDLAVDGEDLKNVRAIIDAFDPGRDYTSLSPWAKGWLERYGPNLIRHAVNVEYAWDTLEGLGLRQKLISLSRPRQPGTLGWWLSREPLRTRPLGAVGGKTAQELGITAVAHETSDFLAYESITRDTTLRPNVLISRDGSPGESASLGDGFYTMVGRRGGKGTGLTIRFTVDPQAREGADFHLHGTAAVFTNRAALRVIPESLDLSMSQYFTMLRDGLVDPSDKGTWMKLKRRLAIRPLSSPEETRVVEMVAEEIDRRGQDEGRSPLLEEWFSLPVSTRHPELIDRLRSAVSALVDRRLVSDLPRDTLPPLVATWALLPDSEAHPELVEKMLAGGLFQAFLAYRVLSRPGWSRRPEVVREMIRTRSALSTLADHVLPGEEWASHPELMRALIESAGEEEVTFTRTGIATGIRKALCQPHWKDPELAALFIEQLPEYARSLLACPQWGEYPELFLILVARKTETLGEGMRNFDWLLQKPHWRDQPELRTLCGGAAPTTRCLDKLLMDQALRAASRLMRELTASPGPSATEGCR